LHLSTDPYESFRIFQGRILEQYLAMSNEFKFTVIDANQSVEDQQNLVRELLSDRIDLGHFKGNGIVPFTPTARRFKWKQEPPDE
jgi:dTMP kinase